MCEHELLSIIHAYDPFEEAIKICGVASTTSESSWQSIH
jgi:hypothetical protein